MKTIVRLLASLAAAILRFIRQTLYPIHSDSQRILSRVADEGYETAHDILFPKEEAKGEKLHFGPVLPG